MVSKPKRPPSMEYIHVHVCTACSTFDISSCYDASVHVKHTSYVQMGITHVQHMYIHLHVATVSIHVRVHVHVVHVYLPMFTEFPVIVHFQNSVSPPSFLVRKHGVCKHALSAAGLPYHGNHWISSTYIQPE